MTIFIIIIVVWIIGALITSWIFGSACKLGGPEDSK